jgi:hypothetical protein
VYPAASGQVGCGRASVPYSCPRPCRRWRAHRCADLRFSQLSVDREGRGSKPVSSADAHQGARRREEIMITGACPGAVVPTWNRRQGRRVIYPAVVLVGWRLWMETRARGSGSRPWPTVLIRRFAASAWLPGLLGARAHTARVPTAFGGGSGPDHAPRRPRSAAQDRAAPEHAWSLPYSNHLLIQESVGRVAVAHSSAGPAPAGGPAGWCSSGSWSVGR